MAKKSLLKKAKAHTKSRQKLRWWDRLSAEDRAAIDEVIDAWNRGELYDNFSGVADMHRFLCQELGLTVKYTSFSRYVRKSDV